jgi:hypothetical protein
LLGGQNYLLAIQSYGMRFQNAGRVETVSATTSQQQISQGCSADSKAGIEEHV